MAEPSAPAATSSQSAKNEAPDPPLPARPKVLYVMGAGHSGSTILGVTLGNCEGFFYAGELEEWLLRSGSSRFGGLERTRFWAAVGERVQGAEELFGGQVVEALERSASRLRISNWRTRRRLRESYRRVADELYRAVANVAGCDCVIDTSHFPLRALELQRLDGIDFYLIYLVRDPQSVVASYTAAINRHASVERTVRIITKNIDLWLTHLLSVCVFLRQRREKRLFVRHEDFVADPQRALRMILDQLGSHAALPDFKALHTGVPIQGNRLLWSDVVALKSRPVRPVHGSRLTKLLQLPWTGLLALLRPAAASISHE